MDSHEIWTENRGAAQEPLTEVIWILKWLCTWAFDATSCRSRADPTVLTIDSELARQLLREAVRASPIVKNAAA